MLDRIDFLKARKNVLAGEFSTCGCAREKGLPNRPFPARGLLVPGASFVCWKFTSQTSPGWLCVSDLSKIWRFQTLFAIQYTWPCIGGTAMVAKSRSPKVVNFALLFQKHSYLIFGTENFSVELPRWHHPNAKKLSPCSGNAFAEQST